MSSANKTVCVVESGDEVFETTIEEFIEANEETFDPGVIEAVRTLPSGATYRGDEGAGGTWILRVMPMYGANGYYASLCG